MSNGGGTCNIDSSLEEWPQYAERREHFFAANSIMDKKKFLKVQFFFLP